MRKVARRVVRAAGNSFICANSKDNRFILCKSAMISWRWFNAPPQHQVMNFFEEGRSQWKPQT
jgi:hypothetical protein